jgi:hypothetical protein
LIFLEGQNDVEEAKLDTPEAKLEKVEAGTAEFLVHLEEKRSIKVGASSTFTLCITQTYVTESSNTSPFRSCQKAQFSIQRN